MSVSASLCFLPGATELAEARVATPTATVSDVCGAPTINAKSDKAVFLWKDCDGTERWHVRITGGGAAPFSTTGTIDSLGGVTGLTRVSIETNDVLDTSTDANQLRYTFRLSGRWRRVCDPAAGCRCRQPIWI